MMVYIFTMTQLEEFYEDAETNLDEQEDNIDQESSTPHFDKLQKLILNSKLPNADKEMVEEAIERYKDWKKSCKESALTGDDLLEFFVEKFNSYKKFIEYNLIWLSEGEFLYRSKGQLKLDNSIIEEFLPMLMDKRIIHQLEKVGFEAGPRKSFSSLYILNNLNDVSRGIKLSVRTKDQDFTIGRRIYLRASINEDFSGRTRDFPIYLAFAAAECKTNLDKTMFQEAISTSHDLKTSIPGSKYFLICEWLDMTPVTTKSTDIDEVLILRGKRMGSGNRKENSNAASRKKRAEEHSRFLDETPVRYEVIKRFVDHIREYLDVKDEDTRTVTERGYF